MENNKIKELWDRYNKVAQELEVAIASADPSDMQYIRLCNLHQMYLNNMEKLIDHHIKNKGADATRKLKKEIAIPTEKKSNLQSALEALNED